MDASIRFRIATRIHHALIRELGEGIDVVMMLGREPYAREVLHVCGACGSRELVRLARHFRTATEQEQRAEREEAALQASWTRRNSGFLTTGFRHSGFRVSQPPFGASTLMAPKKRDESLRPPAPSEPAPLQEARKDPHKDMNPGAPLSRRPWFNWFGHGVN